MATFQLDKFKQWSSPLYPVAKVSYPDPKDPAAYNAHYKPKGTYKARTDYAKPGYVPPTRAVRNGVDLPISQGINSVPAPPDMYNLGQIAGDYDARTPVPQSLSAAYIDSMFTSGQKPSMAAPMDPLKLVRRIAEATAGTPDHAFWVNAFQTLTKLSLIEVSRPLSVDEAAVKTAMMAAIAARAQNLAPGLAAAIAGVPGAAPGPAVPGAPAPGAPVPPPVVPIDPNDPNDPGVVFGPAPPPRFPFNFPGLPGFLKKKLR
jgi:hypothetical protein